MNNISGLQLFQLLRFGSFLITGILLAKGGIGLEIIGAYESLLFVSGALSFFWVNALLTSMLTSYPSHTDQKKYLFNVAVLIAVCSALIFIAIRVAEPFFISLFTKGATPYFHLFSYLLLLNNPCYLIEYIYLIKEKPKHLLVYGIVTFSISIALVVVPLYLQCDLSVSILGLVALAILKLIWLLLLLLRNAEFKLETQFVKQHFYLAFPLLLSFLMSGSADYIDGLMVTHFFGAEQFAIFRYGAKEFPFSLLLANALSMALLPTMSSSANFEEGMNLLKQKSKRLMHFLFPLSMILLLTSWWFYPIVFNHHFAASVPVFNIYLLLIISRLVFPQTLVMALQETRTIFYISIIEIAINVVGSYFLMLHFGLIGIAYGTIIAFFMEKMLLMTYLKVKRNIAPAKYIPIKTWFIYFVLIIICYCFSVFPN